MTRAHLYLIVHLASKAAGGYEEAKTKYKDILKDAVYALNDPERERATMDWYAATSGDMNRLQDRMTDHAMFRFNARQSLPDHVKILAADAKDRFVNGDDEADVSDWPDCPFDVDEADWDKAKADMARWMPEVR